MDREDLLELLHLQIVKVQEQVSAQTSRGERTDRTMGLLRSLRLTLSVLLAGLDPDEEPASIFILSVSEGGQVKLRRDSHLVTLTGSFFKAMFRLGGITPSAGQMLLIEAEFARRAIEDSLGELLAEEFRLSQRRAELRSALPASTETHRDLLLKALGQLDEQESDLLVAKVELAEMNLAMGPSRSASDTRPA
jgi:hypothetical protein